MLWSWVKYLKKQYNNFLQGYLNVVYCFKQCYARQISFTQKLYFCLFPKFSKQLGYVFRGYGMGSS